MKAALATALAAAAVLAVLVIPGTASAHTNGTCTFKSNSLAVGIGLSGADVGGGFCQIFRHSLGSGFHGGRAAFAHPAVACLCQYKGINVFVGVVGERYGKSASTFCKILVPRLSSDWTRIR
jgi:hypothetical protein